MIWNGIFLVLGCITLASCSLLPCGPSKDAFLSRYDKFIERVDDSDKQLSDQEWDKYDEEFRKYVEECYEQYEDEMSSRERRRFWMKSLKYYAMRYGEGIMNELSKENSDLDLKIREHISETLELSGQELENFFEKNGQELEELLESFSSDLEELADKISEIFEVE